MRPLPVRHPGFNSIKVQLEHCGVCSVAYLTNCFNSIKVQLERFFSRLELFAQLMFQFHKGSIRTKHGTERTHRLRCFNSIKVQLEHNFIKVLISVVCCFNSIKVQLEHSDKSFSWSRRLFQFHKGSIRTGFRLPWLLPSSVSIP